jgi:hypothetical protein
VSLRHLIATLAIVLIAAGCGGEGAQLASGASSDATLSTTSPTAQPTAASTPVPAAAATPTAEPTLEDASEPTPEPTPDADTPTLFHAGDVVTVTESDEPYLDIVVSSISQKKSYGSGYIVDRPAKGNIYIQALVNYTALADGATYNEFDWQVFCNDEAVDDFAFVSNGPEPTLQSGTLPKGRKAKGWLVYEVPTTGRCVLSYGANSFISQGAVFEVLIRAK